MTEEYERVREQIARELFGFKFPNLVLSPVEWDICWGRAGIILSLVEIKSDSQSLPKMKQYKTPPLKSWATYQEAQQDMLKAGFIRVVPKPIKEEGK